MPAEPDEEIIEMILRRSVNEGYALIKGSLLPKLISIAKTGKDVLPPERTAFYVNSHDVEAVLDKCTDESIDAVVLHNKELEMTGKSTLLIPDKDLEKFNIVVDKLISEKVLDNRPEIVTEPSEDEQKEFNKLTDALRAKGLNIDYVTSEDGSSEFRISAKKDIDMVAALEDVALEAMGLDAFDLELECPPSTFDKITEEAQKMGISTLVVTQAPKEYLEHQVDLNEQEKAISDLKDDNQPGDFRNTPKVSEDEYVHFTISGMEFQNLYNTCDYLTDDELTPIDVKTEITRVKNNAAKQMLAKQRRQPLNHALSQARRATETQESTRDQKDRYRQMNRER